MLVMAEEYRQQFPAPGEVDVVQILHENGGGLRGIAVVEPRAG